MDDGRGEKYLGKYSLEEFFRYATLGEMEGISEPCAKWLESLMDTAIDYAKRDDDEYEELEKSIGELQDTLDELIGNRDESKHRLAVMTDRIEDELRAFRDQL